MEECPVCFENKVLKLYFNCPHTVKHKICLECYYNCHTCPICRSIVRATLPPLRYPMRPPPEPPVRESSYRFSSSNVPSRDNHVNMFLPGQANMSLLDIDDELEAIRLRRRINNIRNRYGLSNI